MASGGLRASLAVVTPFRDLSKVDVIRHGADLPLELTLSCLHPGAGGVHCGDCDKCCERADAFTAAGVPDRTRYSRAR